GRGPSCGGHRVEESQNNSTWKTPLKLTPGGQRAAGRALPPSSGRGAYHASRKDMLDALGITALINVSANCPNHFEGHYQYKSIPVEDNHKADISSWFNEAIDFIAAMGTHRRALGVPKTPPKHPKASTSHGSARHSIHRRVPTAQGCPHTGTQDRNPA
uniref:protein-tyrosine-phosphatase n=1 Tax=Cyanistes caeruleus TaxID=156563 RepID=A0A8C0U4T8_CYACU